MEHDVDVVLLDIRLPDRPGLEVLAHIKREKPNLPVLIFSTHDKPRITSERVCRSGSRWPTRSKAYPTTFVGDCAIHAVPEKIATP